MVYKILLVVLVFCFIEVLSLKASCSKKDADVLILGAGMAGISAAKTLSDAGVNNLIIFEGRSEIGGRMRSQLLEHSGVRIELGANWIENLDKNNLDAHPLWQLAKQCGGLGGSFQDDIFFENIHAFDDNGKNLTNNSIFRSRLNDLINIRRKIKSYLINATRDHIKLLDVSARSALQQFGWTPKTSIDKAIDWLGSDWEITCPPENASFLFNYPAAHDFMYFVTDQKQGYAKLVHCLADSFLTPKDGRLHLDTTVQKIDWDDNCVCVTVAKDETKKQYCANSAILTFSVGVLKKSQITFSPALPAAKLTAISKIGIGHYLKVFLEFDKIFWIHDKVHTILHVSKDRGYFVHFQSLTQNIPGNPAILLATLTGDIACNLSAKQIKSQVIEVLRRMFNYSVPEPIAVTIPDWCTNPFYHGMYSYRANGFTQSDLDALRLHTGSLYFAGEALVNDGEDGYVHSALRSGVETAEEILALFNI